MPLIHRVIVQLVTGYRYQKLHARVCVYIYVRVETIFGCVHARLSRSLLASLRSAARLFKRSAIHTRGYAKGTSAFARISGNLSGRRRIRNITVTVSEKKEGKRKIRWGWLRERNGDIIPGMGG